MYRRMVDGVRIAPDATWQERITPANRGLRTALLGYRDGAEEQGVQPLPGTRRQGYDVDEPPGIAPYGRTAARRPDGAPPCCLGVRMKFFVTVQASQADYDAMDGTAASPDSPVWSPEDITAMVAFMGALNAELAASGELLDAQGFTAPADARFVTGAPGGAPEITDRPYTGTEVLTAGYWLLECSGLDRVTEIAAGITQCPVPAGSPTHPVVIRPIGEAPSR